MQLDKTREGKSGYKDIQARHRSDLFVCTKDSYFYICGLHFVRGNGPIKEDPDPVSAVAGKERVILSFCAFITLTEKIFEEIFYTIPGCRG